jgi:3,4-dihydroxy 2-butanone 4-phosphate synthase / GTP cyclohydrolase II
LPALNADAIKREPAHRRIDIVVPRVETVLSTLREGGTVCVVEDLGGGAVFAVAVGAMCTPESLNQLVSDAGGIISVTVSHARADALDLPEIVRRKTHLGTPRYAVSVEAAIGVTTGISALDRAVTTNRLCDPSTRARDLVRPGHVMPVRVAHHGVLRHPFGCEAAHDLVHLAGVPDGAVFSHVIDGCDDVTADGAEAFAAAKGWPLVRVSDLLDYRATHEVLVRCVSEGVIATHNGEFLARVYENTIDLGAHIALTWSGAAPEDVADHVPLVRIHSQCLTGDVLHSRRCDCGDQLQEAMRRVAADRRGAIVYMAQEGRGIGLGNKIRAYALQDRGVDTVEANLQLGFDADHRDYAICGQIVRDLGMPSIRLLTNNPEKVEAMKRMGIDVAERVPLEAVPHDHNRRYLQTKRDRMGHILHNLDLR